MMHFKTALFAAISLVLSPAFAAQKSPSTIKSEAVSIYQQNGVRAISPTHVQGSFVDVADSFGGLIVPNTWTGIQTFNQLPVFPSVSNCYIKANGSSQSTCEAAVIGAPTTSVLGGVLATARPANNFVIGVSTSTGDLLFARPSCSNLSNASASCSVDATNASNIGSGTLAKERGGAGDVTGALKANGSGVVSQAACGDLSNASPSCSTDATNPANVAFTATGSSVARTVDKKLKDVVSLTDFGGFASAQTGVCSTTAGSTSVTCSTVADFDVGQYILIPRAGAAFALDAPTSLAAGPCLDTEFNPSSPCSTGGTRTFNYWVACADDNGGMSVAVAAPTITTGTAPLTLYQFNTITWTQPTGSPACPVWGQRPGEPAAHFIGFGAQGKFNDYGTAAPGAFTVSTVAQSGTTVTITTAAAHGVPVGRKITAMLSTTAPNILSGMTVTIVSQGTTDFTLIGAANNNVGTSFTATGAGTGTGIVMLGSSGWSARVVSAPTDTTLTYTVSSSQTYSDATLTDAALFVDEDWVPDTVPGSAQRDWAVRRITAKAGSTLTVDSAIDATVSNEIAFHDNNPAIVNALAAADAVRVPCAATTYAVRGSRIAIPGDNALTGEGACARFALTSAPLNSWLRLGTDSYPRNPRAAGFSVDAGKRRPPFGRGIFYCYQCVNALVEATEIIDYTMTGFAGDGARNVVIERNVWSLPQVSLNYSRAVNIGGAVVEGVRVASNRFRHSGVTIQGVRTAIVNNDAIQVGYGAAWVTGVNTGVGETEYSVIQGNTATGTGDGRGPDLYNTWTAGVETSGPRVIVADNTIEGFCGAGVRIAKADTIVSGNTLGANGKCASAPDHEKAGITCYFAPSSYAEADCSGALVSGNRAFGQSYGYYEGDGTVSARISRVTLTGNNFAGNTVAPMRLGAWSTTNMGAAIERFFGSGSADTAFRLTSDRLAAGATNCLPIPDNTTYSITVNVTAQNTVAAKRVIWRGWQMMLFRDSGAGSTVLSTGTKPTPIGAGGVTGVDITPTADTTNGCLGLTFTPPTGNTDLWRAQAEIHWQEVR